MMMKDAQYAADSGLVEQNIRHHEERIRAEGVLLLRCELWLSNGRGGTTGGGDANRENSSLFDAAVVVCWRRNSAESNALLSNEDMLDQLNTRKDNIDSDRHSENGNTSLGNTAMGDHLANRLWLIHRKNNFETRVLWRRIGSLTDSTEDLPAIPDQQQTRRPSSKSISKVTLSSTTSIDWIASIPFCVPAVAADSTSIEDDARNSTTSIRGMICWLFGPAIASENISSSDENPFPSHLGPFLCSASNHIAVTYALESSFGDLSMSGQKFETQSSAGNSTEIMPNLNNLLTKQQLPPELNHDEDLDSINDSKRNNASTSVLDGDSDYAEIGPYCKTRTLAMVRAYFTKFRGGGKKGPKPLCWRQTLFTFVGSFVTIFLIHSFNTHMTVKRDEWKFASIDVTNREDMKEFWSKFSGNSEWQALEMGPFGATCVLVFAMTSVPPSQPRNMLFGASIGMVVGKLIGYLEPFGVGIGFRMSLATALTACIMAVTCTTYPPGAALAVIFSSKLLGWDRFALQAIGTVLTFSLGVLINNLHPLRVYPTFWLGVEGECGNKKRTSGSESDDNDHFNSCRNIP